MKSISILICAFLAAVTAAGQSKWKHEILIDGLHRGTGYFAVNKDGIPIYTAYTHVPGASNELPQAFRYKTNLTQTYFPGTSQGFTRRINDNGQVGWIGLDSKSLHAMVDGHDYYADIFPPGLPPDDANVIGIDGQGRPFWGASFPGQYSRLFLGGQEIYVGMELSNSSAQATVNKYGDTAFQALSGLTGNSVFDVFHNGVNYSANILGNNRYAANLLSLNDNNDLLWGGAGANTNGESVVFLNDQVYARSQYTDRPAALPVEITNSGHIAWLALTRGVAFLQVDGKDLSYIDGYLDQYEATQSYNYLSESGDIVWLGDDATNSNIRIIAKNQTDISSPLLGDRMPLTDRLYCYGIDDFGDALWSGSGVLTNHKVDTFVNGFNLTQDYLQGQAYDSSGGEAIGPNGQVLWQIVHPDHTFAYILSTPVAEPSTGFMMIAGIFLIRHRRGRAPHRGA